jgi:hypothetical protein
VTAAASAAAIGAALLSELATAQQAGGAANAGGASSVGDPRVRELVQAAERLQLSAPGAIEEYRLSPEQVQQVPADVKERLCRIYTILRPILQLISPLLDPSLQGTIAALMAALDAICGIERQAGGR